MTAVAYAHPTISRFAIADGMLHIGDAVEANPLPAVVQHFSRQVRVDPDFHGRTADLVVRLAGAAPQPFRHVNLPRPPDTDGAVGVDRRPTGLHDR